MINDNNVNNVITVKTVNQLLYSISGSKMMIKILAATIFTMSAMAANAEALVPLKQLVEKVVSSNPEVQAKYHAYVGAGFEQDMAE